MKNQGKFNYAALPEGHCISTHKWFAAAKRIFSNMLGFGVLLP
jgi:hypothetical protein